MSNVVRLRPAVSIRRPSDPLGAIEIGEEICERTASGEIKSIVAMVEMEDGSFEVLQSGCADTVKQMGALAFAQFEMYVQCKADAMRDVP